MEIIQTFEPHHLYEVLEALGFEHYTKQTGKGEFHTYFYRTELIEDTVQGPFKPLALLNYPMIDEELGRIAADFWDLAWNQSIGFFSSEIGPSPLFQAYKLIKTQERAGKSRDEIKKALIKNFGEKNAEVSVQ